MHILLLAKEFPPVIACNGMSRKISGNVVEIGLFSGVYLLQLGAVGTKEVRGSKSLKTSEHS